MMKTKHLSLIAIASTAFLFSGCVPPPHTLGTYDRGYSNNAPRLNVSLVSYDYPYYFDRPYYFLEGLYYYGGYYRNGWYHYGQRRFRQGHYYNDGNRYYNGRRYRARNGRYGYYRNQSHYNRSNVYRTKRRSLDRGRNYNAQRQQVVRPSRNYIGGQRTNQVRTHDNSWRDNTQRGQVRPNRNYIGTQRLKNVRSRSSSRTFNTPRQQTRPSRNYNMGIQKSNISHSRNNTMRSASSVQHRVRSRPVR